MQQCGLLVCIQKLLVPCGSLAQKNELYQTLAKWAVLVCRKYVLLALVFSSNFWAIKKKLKFSPNLTLIVIWKNQLFKMSFTCNEEAERPQKGLTTLFTNFNLKLFNKSRGTYCMPNTDNLKIAKGI